MKVLTFNVGLLDVRLLGYSLLRPAAWIEERFAAMSDSFRSLSPDLLLLQEIYDQGHKESLATSLRDCLPFRAMPPTGGSLMPSSLLILSRWPMSDVSFHRFRHMPLAEKLIDNKGFLACTLRCPGGDLRVANVHTTAGGSRHPEHPKSDRIRARQIGQMIDCMRADVPTLLAGDFNCGSVSPHNYQQLLSAGYADVWASLCPGDAGWTWEPTSVLNANGTHSDWGCPAQRIDLLLVNQPARRALPPLSCTRVFTAADLPVRPDLKVTLSDHYGVLAVLGEGAG